MGQFSMKICPQVGQFLMELNTRRDSGSRKPAARIMQRLESRWN
jgi:hypothetical protein